MACTSGVPSRSRKTCIAAITMGWELNVPRAKHTSAGCSSLNRRMRSLRPQTTPTGNPPPSVFP